MKNQHPSKYKVCFDNGQISETVIIIMVILIALIIVVGHQSYQIKTLQHEINQIQFQDFERQH